MWVFDGEEWTDEGGSSKSPEAESRARYEQFMPELQVIEVEIVPLPRRNDLPMLPLP
jgi:hypothetical protein